MIDPAPSATALSGATLLSGAIGAVAASAISWFASNRIDKKNKNWALKAELRRHRVSRIVAANDGLRTCFFMATTQLDYHFLALVDIEAENAKPFFNPAEGDARKARHLHEIERYNEKIGTIEAAAKAHAAFLEEDLIPADLRVSLRAVLGELTSSHTGNAASVMVRIEFFKSKASEVMSILKKIDNVISKEIASPL
jgi:hypothetical protein